ncbi:MAG TPA: DNA-formamidopyrimidine glycosylase family protein [Vicinamibacterales bacterium]
MPELPDVTIYLEALTRHVVGQSLERITLFSPFVLRSVDPAIDAVFGRRVSTVRRVGKRIALEFEKETPADPPLFIVIHLMIAGRLRWRAPGEKLGIGSKLLLASFTFPSGTMYFTEASSKKRASIQVVRGEESLHALNPGGIEALEASLDDFRAALVRENHTVKRSLTDPHLFSGIGNAYSDEILHAARLSPLKLTRSLSDAEIGRLYEATRATLREWTARLRAATGDGFPEKVTAFHDQMAVHGRFKEPCPVCGAPVQRIVYADNECNYCAVCQTGGRLLADRSLSRLLKDDWPKSIDQLE